MTLPHQCRCAICGEIGTIVPGLPNVFANQQRDNLQILAAEQALSQGAQEKPSFCAHGYTVCARCQFPATSTNTPEGG